MVYATALVNQQTNPTQVVYTALSAALGSHPSWSKVESALTDNGSTYDVWKNSANDLGGSFYLIVAIATVPSSGPVVLSACEQWDTTAHKGTYFCVNTYDTLGADGAPSTARTPSTPFSANWCTNSLQVSTGAFTYWIVVTRNGVWAQTDCATNTNYTGVCTNPFNPNLVNFTGLVVANVNGNGLASRRPTLDGAPNAIQWPYYWLVEGFPQQPVETRIGVVGVPGHLAIGTRLAMTFYQNNYGLPDYNGDSRIMALYPGALMFYGATVALGDTLTVGGDTYVCMYSQSPSATGDVLFVDTQAA